MNKKKHILELDSPAEEWRDAWPSGNGTVGTLVSGNLQHERIIVNHEKHWLYGKVQPLPDVSFALDKVRELVEGRDFQKAHNCHRDVLHEAGYKPVMSDYSPVFTLEIIDQNFESCSSYSRTLNMETGESVVKWQIEEKQYQRRLFVSRHSGKIHSRLSAETAASLNLLFRLSPLAEEAGHKYLESHNLVFEHESGKNYLMIKGQDIRDKCFGGVMSLDTDGDTVTQNDDLYILNASYVDLEIEVFADCDTNFCSSFHNPADYDDELASHIQIHGELYQRLELNLRNSDMLPVQQMFDYGRYLLISSAGSQLPPNLQGLWNGDNHPIWNCFYMLNENVQMMHWQILPGNMPELMHSLFEYYEALIDDFRENARKLFDCRGIFIPANTVPETGLITDLQGHLIYWTGGAAWLSRLYFDYYLYTEDKTFLKEKAMPFMKEAADFYEDYVYRNEKGEIEFCPSISPENAPEAFNVKHKMDANCNITKNAAMDIALCKELLTHLIEGAEICGIYEDAVPRWKDMLEKLPAYTVNDDGAICEWIHNDFSDNYHHRHVSHIYPFFPGCEMSGEDEMLKAIEIAVDKRFEIGMREQTGWSVVHLANIYARLGRGDRAMECLDILKEYCTGINLFTYHNDWRDRGVCMTKPKNFDKRVFQIDANMGYPAAILEMLVYSRPGSIHLLPGLPPGMKEGEVKGLLCRGNILLNMDWSEQKVGIVLKSASDQTVQIGLSSGMNSTFSADLRAGQWQRFHLERMI
ncbi:MAG: glycoside hydrolase N-terminal domain-containing protein [Spirochaetales bacterium]|nr:glycoside hydrolase N-terminal domain-containing protein [Spirochaetales bacterium]